MEKLNFIRNKFKNFDEEFYSELVENSVFTTLESKYLYFFSLRCCSRYVVGNIRCCGMTVKAAF